VKAPGSRRELVERAEQLQSERLGDSLVRLGRRFFERTVERLREEGYPGVRFSFTSLLPHLDRREGTRTTELARKMDVSKQAVGQLVQQLETLGYVERGPDPDDGRARRVLLTERGLEVVLAGLAVYEDLERELAEELGSEGLDAFKDASRRALELFE